MLATRNDFGEDRIIRQMLFHGLEIGHMDVRCEVARYVLDRIGGRARSDTAQLDRDGVISESLGDCAFRCGVFVGRYGMEVEVSYAHDMSVAVSIIV